MIAALACDLCWARVADARGLYGVAAAVVLAALVLVAWSRRR